MEHRDPKSNDQVTAPNELEYTIAEKPLSTEARAQMAHTRSVLSFEPLHKY